MTDSKSRLIWTAVAGASSLLALAACTGLPPRSFSGGTAHEDAGVDSGANVDAGADGDAATDAGAETDAGADAGTDSVDAGADAGTDSVDAGVDAGADAGFDADAGAGADAGFDAGNPDIDAGSDGGADAGSDGGSVWPVTEGIGSNEIATAVAIDSNGNIYVAGYTNGSLFYNLQGPNSTDYFIARYDSTGARIWARQFGTPQNDQAFGVAVDVGGSPYVTGLTGANNSDAFVAKFTATTGDLVWQSNIATASYDRGIAIGFDSNPGDVYVAGETYGILADGGLGSNSDMFVARVNAADGGRAWVVQYGSNSHDFVSGIAINPTSRLANGNDPFSGVFDIFVLGSTNWILPDAGGSGGAYIAQFDTDGGKGWTLQFGPSSSRGAAFAIRPVPNNNPIFHTLIDGAGGYWGIPGMGGREAYYIKIESNLSISNVVAFQSTSDDWGNGLGLDTVGNVYVVGTTLGTMAAGSTSHDAGSAFLARVNASNGTKESVRQSASSGGVSPLGLAMTTAGTVGLFVGGFDGGSFGGKNSDGGVDYFIMQFSSDGGF